MSSKPVQSITPERAASRRNVIRAAAWTAPAVSIVVAAPAFAVTSVAFAPPAATISRASDGKVTAEITCGNGAVVVSNATLQMYNGTSLVNGKFGIVNANGWTGGSNANASSGLYTPTAGSLGVGQKSTTPAIALTPQGNGTINKVTVTFSWTRPGNTQTFTTTAQVTF